MSTIKLPLLELRSYQKPVWNYMMQDKTGLRAVTIWPRRNGKDLVAINIMAAKALQRKGDYAYIAPYSNQCRGIIWEGNAGTGERFIDYVPREVISRKLDQQMKIWLKDGSTIQLFGSDNPDALVGRNFMGLIFTEYPLHQDVVWGFLRPMLAENGGWALFNGTPRGLNHGHTIHQVAQKNDTWFNELLTCEDTGYPSQEDIQKEREAGMLESLIEQEFYCSWTSSTEETLIPLDRLDICVQTELLETDYDFAPRVIGVDPAYAEKGDYAVIARRQGRKVFPPESFQGIDPMALATRVAKHIQEWKPHWVFVDAGRGEAVWSRLYQLGYEDRVIPVHFGGKTYSDLYHKKKDEIWGRMKTAICSHEAPVDLPDHQELIRDLSAPTFEINDRGLMQLENKKSLAKRGFRSTDYGDALALTWSEELAETQVVTKEMQKLGITEDILHQIYGQTQVRNYDPLTYMDSYTRTKDTFI